MRLPVFFSFTALTLAMSASPAQALEPLSATVVTAARLPQTLDQVTADISVITHEAIVRSGATGVADVLARLPGVQLNRNGGPGQSTSVYLRGTSNQHALVLVDGVRFSSQELQGGVSWPVLPLAQIQRIEVLRGPAAAVYGSDAMGGVIHIITDQGSSSSGRPSLEWGIGTQGGSKVTASLQGGHGSWTYGLQASDERSKGYDIGSPYVTNPDRDGYANTALGLQAGYRQGIHDVQARLLHTRLRSHYESTPAPFDDYDTVQSATTSLRWSADWSARYRSTLQLSHKDLRTHRHTASEESLNADSLGLLWQNIWNAGAHRWNLDFEVQDDRLDTQYAFTQNTRSRRLQHSLALGWAFSEGPHTLNAHLRHDTIRQQQGKTTGAIGYALQFTPHWRWTASAGTAFRTPTLYERNTGQAAPDLRAESSRNLETGIQFDQGTHQWSVVMFRNRFHDLIAWDGTCTVGAWGCYANISRADIKGMTLAGKTQLGAWKFDASLDLLHPEDLDRQRLLTHRSKRSFRLHANTQVDQWTVGIEAALHSQRATNASNTQYLPGYGLVHLYAQRALGRDWQILARLDNAANKSYELARGYAMPGRTAFISLRWTPH